MTPTSSFVDKHTYMPEPASQVTAFAEFLRAGARQADVTSVPLLISSEGVEKEIPEEIYAALVQIADALSDGRGVTVVPTDTQLTTQEAADFLGYSRPTLVKLLEEGSIAFTKVGRHRRVLLRDLIAYEERARQARRNALNEIARDSVGDGSLFTPEPPDHLTR